MPSSQGHCLFAFEGRPEAGVLPPSSKWERLAYEERFTKRTFLVERELIERLDKIADKRPKVFKARLINELLAAGLRQIEEQSK